MASFNEDFHDREKSDVDEVPAGTASPEKTSEITRAPAGYEAMMLDDMARYGHPAWDLWMTDMAKEMPGRSFPDSPTLQQEEFGYVRKGHIADNRVSPNKVPHYALSSKSATEIVVSILSEIVDMSTSPRQDKVTSPLAIPNDYPDCHKKYLSCNENITSQGLLPLSKMLSIDDDDSNEKGRCADKAGMQQPNIANTSNKEIEELIDNRSCSWREMYEEIKNTKSKTATPRITRKLSKQESMWYTNRAYKEDATAYFFDPILMKQRPCSSTAVSRLEASLGYTEPVRGTRVIQTGSQTSILSDEELPPRPERPIDTTLSPDNYAMIADKAEIRRRITASPDVDALMSNNVPTLKDVDINIPSTTARTRFWVNTATCSITELDEFYATNRRRWREAAAELDELTEMHRKRKLNSKAGKDASRVMDAANLDRQCDVRAETDSKNTIPEEFNVLAQKARLLVEEFNEKSSKMITPAVFEEKKEPTQAHDNVEKAVQNDKITKSKKGLKQRFKSTKIGKAIFKKSEKKSACEIVEKKKKGGVIGYLRSSWIGRKLCLSKSMTQN